MYAADKSTPPKGRKSRFFEREGLWYFATREAIDVGPFETYDEAKEGADMFLDYVNEHPNEPTEVQVKNQPVWLVQKQASAQ